MTLRGVLVVDLAKLARAFENFGKHPNARGRNKDEMEFWIDPE
jgi:hypothetical protein